MVHFRRNHEKISSDNFWKLIEAPAFSGMDYWTRRDVDGNEVGVAVTASQGRALHLSEQRGCVDYTTCTFGELKKFCLARGQNVKDNDSDDSWPLIAQLQKMDEEAKFTGFQDLPPELRMRIYEWHQAWLPFGPTGEFSKPPPIASVSKTVRHESLAVFFRERMFFLRGGIINSPFQQMHDFFSKSTFLQHVNCLTIMSPITISVEWQSENEITYQTSSGFAEWRVNLAGKSKEDKASFVSIGTAELRGGQTDLQKKAEDIAEGLEKFVELVTARRPVAFQANDADKIANVVVEGKYC